MIQYNTMQYNIIRYNCGENETSLALIGQRNQIELCNTIQYNIIQYNGIQYDTIQYNTIRYNVMQYHIIQYIQYNCGENETSLALIEQRNQIEQYNTIYNTT